MARRTRTWEELTERHRARLQRYGITPSYYETGGTLQLARGHRPREHVTRRERNPLGLTGTDYRFLKNQQRRAGREDFSRQTRAYKRLSLQQRATLRDRVARDHREYKRQKSKSGIVRGDKAELRRELQRIVESVGGEEARGGGGFYDKPPVEYAEEPEHYVEFADFDQYEDIYAEVDELDDLLFYH